MKRHEKNKDPNKLTLGEHLRELKRRVFSILLAFVVVFILAYVKSERQDTHLYIFHLKK